MLDQRGADLTSRSVQRAEHPGMKALGGDGAGDDLGGKLAGSRMRGMRLDDHRASGRERRGGIAAAHGKSQRKIAGTEDDDRAEGPQQGAEIRAGEWLTIGESRVDARLHPGALF